MNVIERVIRRVDGWQQRHKATAFGYAVTKKYGDDNAGQLVTGLAHTAFVSLFPLLLVLATILGLVASFDPALHREIITAVSHQFPLIGNQLTGHLPQLRRSSVIGLIIGLLVTLWGATGLAQNGMYTMAQVWNVPGPERPGYLQRLGRTGLFFLVLGVPVLATTALSSLTSFGHHSGWIVVAAEVLALAANIGMYILAFRVLTPKIVSTRKLLPGAIVGGVAWSILQAAGTLVVGHFVKSTSIYGIFGIVLALLAWIYLVVQVTVYSAEVNVVLARRLWPRSIVQPPLTGADREALALQPLQNQRREDQHITVTFTDEKAESDKKQDSDKKQEGDKRDKSATVGST
jgi:YihY family inner membrane protein